MAAFEDTVEKIKQLPEPLVQEVSDFVDFLMMKSDKGRWQQWLQFSEAQELAEAGFSDYLYNLESYENDLANGKIKW